MAAPSEIPVLEMDVAKEEWLRGWQRSVGQQRRVGGIERRRRDGFALCKELGFSFSV